METPTSSSDHDLGSSIALPLSCPHSTRMFGRRTRYGGNNCASKHTLPPDPCSCNTAVRQLQAQTYFLLYIIVMHEAQRKKILSLAVVSNILKIKLYFPEAEKPLAEKTIKA